MFSDGVVQSIIKVLCKRTKEQVELIDAKFRERYGKTLRQHLESDLSGDFKKFAVFTQMEEDEFDALLIQDAVQGGGTNEDLLLEVLTTRSNARLMRAREYYEKRFDESLVDRVNSELSGDLKKLANRLLTLNRDEDDGQFDPEDAAVKLYEASVGRTFGTDVSAIRDLPFVSFVSLSGCRRINLSRSTRSAAWLSCKGLVRCSKRNTAGLCRELLKKSSVATFVMHCLH